ncbi:hypothetical protein BT93_L5141 [Corymbia citriodora subsp. variegata]|uniref:Uncharacterized protein n=1 Tax=Corymbia citriodora subsp. variegata TaxID=360336 RepID=A0A8T0CSW6_CORYI|nr:hypothetical protein BT93_L5141 [Corymbia citriodora subsp. variegata]
MDAKGAAKRIAMALFMVALILQAPGVTEATSLKCKILIGICKASCAITIKPPLCLDQCIPPSCLKAMSAEALNSCNLRCEASVCFKRYSAAEKIEDCLASCYDDCKKSPTRS